MEEIGKKNDQIASLEKQISDSIIPNGKEDRLEDSLVILDFLNL